MTVETWTTNYSGHTMAAFGSSYVDITWALAQKPAGTRVHRIYQMNCIPDVLAAGASAVVRYSLSRDTVTAGATLSGSALSAASGACSAFDSINTALSSNSVFGAYNGGAAPTGFTQVGVIKSFSLHLTLTAADRTTITSQLAWLTNLSTSKIFDAIDTNVQPLVLRPGEALTYRQLTARSAAFAGGGYNATTIFTNEAS